MKPSRIVVIFLIACAALVWLFNGTMVVVMLTGKYPMKHAETAPEEKVFSSMAAVADSALKYRPKSSSARFNGNFENPFRSAGEAFAPSVKKSAPLPGSQVKLTLKGVLLKKQPLAILEDESGKTYICGVDETVKEQRVVKIESTSVTLRNSLGAYTLTVKE
jgi:hypothetical protein